MLFIGVSSILWKRNGKNSTDIPHWAIRCRTDVSLSALDPETVAVWREPSQLIRLEDFRKICLDLSRDLSIIIVLSTLSNEAETFINVFFFFLAKTKNKIIHVLHNFFYRQSDIVINRNRPIEYIRE